MFKAELQEEIGKAIPRIVECLKGSSSDDRSATVRGLSSLGAHRTCPCLSPAGVLNGVGSAIWGGDWQGHTSHC